MTWQTTILCADPGCPQRITTAKAYPNPTAAAFAVLNLGSSAGWDHRTGPDGDESRCPDHARTQPDATSAPLGHFSTSQATTPGTKEKL